MTNKKTTTEDMSHVKAVIKRKKRICPICNSSDIKKLPNKKYICNECDQALLLEQVTFGKRRKYAFVVDNAVGVSPKGQLISNERRYKIYTEKDLIPKVEVPDGPVWKLTTTPHSLTEIYVNSNDENHFMVKYPPYYSGFLYCPKCGKKAQQTTQALGILQYKCKNSYDNKRCGALVDFVMGEARY